MTETSPHIKSPFLAGVLGVIPGFGHLYAGQKDKAALLAVLLLISFLFCLSWLLIPAFHQGYQPFLSGSVYYYEYHSPHGNFFIHFSPLKAFVFIALIAGVIVVLFSKQKQSWFILFAFVLIGYFGLKWLGLIHSPYYLNQYYLNQTHNGLWSSGWGFRNAIPVMNQSMMLLGLLFFAPLLMLYSIADAVISVVHHNRRVMFSGMEPPPAQPINPQPPTGYWSGNTEQDALRQGARERGIPI